MDTIFRMSAIPVLMPLTIDRLVALVFPMRYKSFIRRLNCRIMVALTWIALIPIIIVDIVTMANGTNKVWFEDTIQSYFNRQRTSEVLVAKFKDLTFNFDFEQIIVRYFQLLYQNTYHRCVFEADLAWKKSIYVLFPFAVIIIMYITMVFFVRRAKLETKKLLIISSLIIVTGLITNVPDQLLVTFKVS